MIGIHPFLVVTDHGDLVKFSLKIIALAYIIKRDFYECYIHNPVNILL